jgi:hypothetical protein
MVIVILSAKIWFHTSHARLRADKPQEAFLSFSHWVLNFEM